MKHGFASSSCSTSVVERYVRFRGKTDEGKVSPKTFASILAHSRKPISRKAHLASVGDGVCTIWHLNLQSIWNSANVNQS